MASGAIQRAGFGPAGTDRRIIVHHARAARLLRQCNEWAGSIEAARWLRALPDLGGVGCQDRFVAATGPLYANDEPQRVWELLLAAQGSNVESNYGPVPRHGE